MVGLTIADADGIPNWPSTAQKVRLTVAAQKLNGFWSAGGKSPCRSGSCSPESAWGFLQPSLTGLAQLVLAGVKVGAGAA